MRAAKVGEGRGKIFPLRGDFFRCVEKGEKYLLEKGMIRIIKENPLKYQRVICYKELI